MNWVTLHPQAFIFRKRAGVAYGEAPYGASLGSDRVKDGFRTVKHVVPVVRSKHLLSQNDCHNANMQMESSSTFVIAKNPQIPKIIPKRAHLPIDVVTDVQFGTIGQYLMH